MKRFLLIVAIVAFTLGTAAASGGRPKNLNIFGSDDHQRSHNHVVVDNTHRQWDSVTPTPPNPIPEPATLFLLGAGLVGIAAWRKK